MTIRDAVAIAQRAIAAMDNLTRDQLRIYNRALVEAYTEQSDRLIEAVQRGDRDGIQVELRKLGELSAAAGDEYEQQFQRILTEATENGVNLADELVRAYDANSVGPMVGNVNFEAVAVQSRDGMRRLRNHTEEAARNIQAIVTRGLAAQIGTVEMRDRIMGQLGILKARATNIARTETMSALNTSTQERYQNYNITHVQLLAIIDDETTPECRFRHLKVIRNNQSRPPYHYQCRTIAMPVRREWLTQEDYDFAAKEYSRAAEGALNQTSIFERANNITPPDPILTLEAWRG